MKDLSLHLMDILQNSVTAGANRINVTITVILESGMLVVVIDDDGSGMDAKMLGQVTDPFVTTRDTRRVGLGIPLLKASAERSLGWLSIESEKGRGTRVEASFKVSSVDRPPIGDIACTIADVAAADGSDVSLALLNGEKFFRFDTCEVKRVLDGVPINDFEVVSWIRDYLDENIKAIFGGVLDEVDCRAGRDKEEKTG